MKAKTSRRTDREGEDHATIVVPSYIANPTDGSRSQIQECLTRHVNDLQCGQTMFNVPAGELTMASSSDHRRACDFVAETDRRSPRNSFKGSNPRSSVFVKRVCDAGSSFSTCARFSEERSPLNAVFSEFGRARLRFDPKFSSSISGGGGASSSTNFCLTR